MDVPGRWRHWVEDARAAGLREHDAVALTTADAGGRRSARTVSLRRVEHAGLIFTTALGTRKARNPRGIPHSRSRSTGRRPAARCRCAAAGSPPLGHRPTRSSPQRDRAHQLQAMMSPQGGPISGLAPLRDHLATIRLQVGDDPIPCPACAEALPTGARSASDRSSSSTGPPRGRAPRPRPARTRLCRSAPHSPGTVGEPRAR